MSSWRDDLPPIPSERIREAAMREGRRRGEVRARRQRAFVYGGLGAAAVALIVYIGAASRSLPDEEAGDDAASATTEAAVTAEAAATTAAAPTTAATTAAPETTAAATEETAAATTAPPVTEAPATTSPFTTVGGSIAEQPVSAAVEVSPTFIFEEPPPGLACGPSMLEVEFIPPGGELGAPVVHWEVAGVQGDAPMIIAGVAAEGTVGPFPADTLDSGTRHEVLIYVTDTEVSGDEIFRAPTVVLGDCSP
jgi:hypothetical protein